MGVRIPSGAPIFFNMNTLEITGLSPRQKFFADAMWKLSEEKAVSAFIKSLPLDWREECMTIKEMMVISFIDQIDDFSVAAEYLEKFR